MHIRKKQIYRCVNSIRETLKKKNKKEKNSVTTPKHTSLITLFQDAEVGKVSDEGN